MITLATRKFYFWFLAGTLFPTVLIYLTARQWSWATVFFIVINIGNAHYLMAYFGNIRRWSKFPLRIAATQLTLWVGLSLLYWLIFYKSGLDFAWALLSVFLIAAIHFFRDYAFFYHQFLSSFTKGQRPLSLTILMGGVYVASLFALLYYYPQKIFILFGAPLPPMFFLITGVTAAVAAAAGGYFFFTRYFELRHAPRFVGAFALPYGSTGVLGALDALNPIDLVYLLVLWHYLLWLGFMFMKTFYGKPYAASTTFERMLTLGWNNVAQLAGNTAIFHALVFITPFFLIDLGIFPSFHSVAYNSIIWGLYGYPLWSFLHIAFTALPLQFRKT